MRKLFIVTALSLFMIGTSFAQGIQFKSVTARAGLILPDSPWDTGFLIGAEADLGINVNNIAIVPVASYWHSSYSYNSFGSYDLSLSNFQIGADAHYSLDEFSQIKGLYAGGGLSLNFESIDVPNYFSSGTSSTTDTNIGFNILAGYNVALGAMNGVAQARYNLISNLNTFELTFGIMFDMAK